MRNLLWCHLGVLAIALRHTARGEVIPFKHALDCVGGLVDFNMMAQYRRQTPATIAFC